MVLGDVVGTRSFHILQYDRFGGSDLISKPDWVLNLNEFRRISSIQGTMRVSKSIVLKLSSPYMHKSFMDENLRRDVSSFDCLSIFKHSE